MAEGPYQTRHSGPQPTASTARIDLSASPSRASAADREAFENWSDDGPEGYVWRTARCVCTGVVSVPWPCPDDVLIRAQYVHNRSLLHVTWRAHRAVA